MLYDYNFKDQWIDSKCIINWMFEDRDFLKSGFRYYH